MSWVRSVKTTLWLGGGVHGYNAKDAELMSRCRSCGAEVIWTTTVRGQKHPLDAVPVLDGPWVIRPGVSGPRLVQWSEAQAPDEPRYTSHFQNCPQSKEWSQKNKGKGTRDG